MNLNPADFLAWIVGFFVGFYIGGNEIFSGLLSAMLAAGARVLHLDALCACERHDT